MKRGYVRQIKGRKEADQRAALEADGVTAIYSDSELEDAVNSLREGDELVIAGGLHLLANNRRAIREIVDAVHAQGAVIYDLETDRSSAGYGVALLDDAIMGLTREVRFGDAQKAGKLGSKARWAETQIRRMDEDEARKIWEDTSLSMPQAIAKMTGWKQTTAYNRFGAAGRGAGRKKGQKVKRKKGNRGRVYFIQNPDTKRVRIGYTTRPLARLAEHQGGHDCDLDFLAIIDGTPKTEKALHEKFKKHRKRGSWYEPAPELMEHIACLAGQKDED